MSMVTTSDDELRDLVFVENTSPEYKCSLDSVDFQKFRTHGCSCELRIVNYAVPGAHRRVDVLQSHGEMRDDEIVLRCFDEPFRLRKENANVVSDPPFQRFDVDSLADGIPIRFEKGDGSLYDFGGASVVRHLLLFEISCVT